MRRWRVVGALLLAVPAVDFTGLSTAHGGPACRGDGERIVAYSLDRYATQSEPNAAEPQRSRFLIRRLGTDEALEQVDCAVSGPCELTSVLGMRGCSYARVSPGKVLRGLSLDAVGNLGGFSWSLSIEAESTHIPVLSLRSAGPLALTAAVRAGRRVVVILSETLGDSCPQTKDYAVLLEEGELRVTGGALAARPARAVDLTNLEGEPLPPPRTAKPFRAMQVNTVVKAARTAAAAGLTYLARCWIAQNASVMTPRELPALARALADDPILSPLVPFARRKHHRRQPATTPSVDVASGKRRARRLVGARH
jgi:hypothetical protein